MRDGNRQSRKRDKKERRATQKGRDDARHIQKKQNKIEAAKRKVAFEALTPEEREAKKTK